MQNIGVLGEHYCRGNKRHFTAALKACAEVVGVDQNCAGNVVLRDGTKGG